MAHVEEALSPTEQLRQCTLGIVGREVQGAGVVVARSERDDRKAGPLGGVDAHEAADHLVDHPVASHGDHRVAPRGACGQLLGIARRLGQLQVERRRRRRAGLEEATHHLGTSGTLTTVRCRVGNDERRSEVCTGHGTPSGVFTAPL